VRNTNPGGAVYGAVIVANADGSGAVMISPDSNSINYFSPTWSPDGQHIAYNSNASLVIGSPATGQTETVIGLGDQLGHTFYYPQWSPDGAHIAFMDFVVGLVVVNADGSGRVVALHDLFESPFEWSPDGQTLATDSLGYILTVHVDGTGER